MLKPDQLHPYVRYGIATALVDWNQNTEAYFNPSSEQDWKDLAVKALTRAKTGLLLKGQPDSSISDQAIFRDIAGQNLNPGKKNKQSAEFGVYVAPHVLTSQNAAGIATEIKGLIKALQRDKETRSYELKRSFSPLIAKINAGRGSMSNPKEDLLVAAFTAICTATKRKAAALDYQNGDNLGLIPDLPLCDEKSQLTGPLYNYLLLLERLQNNRTKSDLKSGKYDPDKEKYSRPKIFQGNFAGAIKNVNLGSIALVAALGKWVQENRALQPEDAVIGEKVIALLSRRPFYLVSYAGTSQQAFSHHLVPATIQGHLHAALRDILKIEILGLTAAQKYSSPKWELLRMYLDRFLQFFRPSDLSNFLSIRATYPSSYYLIFKTYLMEVEQFKPEFIESAMAFGKAINSAAYAGAQAEVQDDKKKKLKAEQTRNVYEHKARILNQLESYIRGAESKLALLSSISTVIGRISGYDIPTEARLFETEFLTNNSISLQQGQQLLIIAMRLDQRAPKKTIAASETSEFI
ncbi:MAG: hypothetical protein AAF433_14190 [Bacteroidota bacterium]